MTTMHTASGRLVDPFNFSADDVCLEDIAHHLAHTVRFGGATPVSTRSPSTRAALRTWSSTTTAPRPRFSLSTTTTPRYTWETRSDRSSRGCSTRMACTMTTT